MLRRNSSTPSEPARSDGGTLSLPGFRSGEEEELTPETAAALSAPTRFLARGEGIPTRICVSSAW